MRAQHAEIFCKVDGIPPKRVTIQPPHPLYQIPTYFLSEIRPSSCAAGFRPNSQNTLIVSHNVSTTPGEKMSAIRQELWL